MRVFNVLFDDRYGGPNKRVVQVATRLVERDIHTVMCLPEGNGNAAEEASKVGVPVLRVGFGRTPRPRDLKKVARWAAGLPGDVRRFMKAFRGERPDVVHVNGAFFVAPAVAAKLARIPLVWHLNDTILPARVAPFFGAMVRVMANRVVVAAEAVARHYGVAHVPHQVIHAPVDVRLYDGRPLRRRGDGPSRVGLVANWNPLKGHEYFVRAAAMVRARLEGETEIVLAGARLATHPEYARRVEALIDELGLRPAVRDLGFVAAVEKVLQDLDVLVLSSTTEASPMVVLEGMAAGVPVVATDVGGVREMLLAQPAEPAGVVVPPRDPEALALAVLGVLGSAQGAAKLGRSGSRRAREHFSLEKCASLHAEVYSEVTPPR